MNLEQYQSIITKYNLDTKGNPIAIVKIDSQKIHPTKFMIQTGILDEFHRVVILNRDMNEVFNIDDIFNLSDFYVDYDNGRMFFHSGMAGQTIEYRCAELGVDIINASRVASGFDEKGNVKEVLSDLIENVNNAIITKGIIKENHMIIVPAESLSLNTNTDLYEYILPHNLKTNKIQLELYSDSEPLMNLCRKLDSDNIVVANDEKIDIEVVINYGSVN